jgi:hypothetical protein
MTTVWRLKLRCDDCGHIYRRTVGAEAEPDPPCPICARMPRPPIGLDLAAGKAPAVASNPTVKAMDWTMEAVAQDYGLTDLKTDGRDGATMAPSLPPAQQAMADAMFNPAARAKQMQSANPAVAARLNQIAATAKAGGYAQNDPTWRPDPVAAAHKGRARGEPIKVNIVAGDGPRGG